MDSDIVVNGTRRTRKETAAHNERTGERLRVLREARNMTQEVFYTRLGYKGGAAGSLIEKGRRGLNRTKLRLAAKLLGTYPEVLSTDTELSREELLDLDLFMRIRKNPDDPAHKKIMKELHDARRRSTGPC